MPMALQGDVLRIISLDPEGPDRSTLVKQIALRMLRDQGVTNIRMVCQSGIFKHPTGNLAASVRGDIDEDGVTFSNDAPYARAVEEGVRPHTMWHLAGKTVPIKKFAGGQQSTIFRKATIGAMLRGKWKHPGSIGKRFMKKGVERTVAELPRILGEARRAVERLSR